MDLPDRFDDLDGVRGSGFPAVHDLYYPVTHFGRRMVG